MRITAPAVEIGQAEGFTASKDLFGRAALGDGLANLFGRIEEPLVVAIDGQWGTGKTTFLKMWAGHMRTAGFPVIQFDAFESDYFDDAFLPLAGEIVALAQSAREADSSAQQIFMRKAARAGGVLLRSALKIGVKAATFNAVDTDAIADEISLAVGEEASQLTDSYVGALLTKHAEHRSILRDFRQALADLPELLTRPNPPRPLIVVIDELDRCRPHFALQILERMKHFFSVPNVHFVLGVNLKQLRNSVTVEYGPGVDANLYLQKFINLRFQLPDDAVERRDRVAPKFLAHLKKELNFDAKDYPLVDVMDVMLQHIVEGRGLSLREIERIMSVFALSLGFSGRNSMRPPHILAGLCILKVVNPELFDLARHGKASYTAVAPELGLIEGDLTTAPANTAHRRASMWWGYCLDRPVFSDAVSQFEQYLDGYDVERTRAIPYVASQIVEGLRAPTAP